MRSVAMEKAIKNDQWISDEEDLPDPKKLPHLPGYNLLIRPVSVRGVTTTGYPHTKSATPALVKLPLITSPPISSIAFISLL